MIEDIVRKSEEVIFYSTQDHKLVMIDAKTHCQIDNYQQEDKGNITQNCLEISKKYGQIIGGQQNSTFIIQIDIGNKNTVRKSSMAERICALKLSDDELIMVGAGISGNIYLWSTIQGLLLGQLKLHYNKINRMNLIYNGSCLMSCSDDGQLSLLHLSTVIIQNQLQDNKSEDNIYNEHIIRMYDGHVGPVIDFVITRGESMMVSLGQDNNLIFWDIQSTKKIHNIVLNGPAGVILFNSFQDRIIVGANDSNIYVHVVYTNNRQILNSKGNILEEKSEGIVVFKGHSAAVSHLQLQLEDDLLVSASQNGEIIFWNYEGVIKKKIQSQGNHPITNLIVCQRPIDLLLKENLITQKKLISFNTFKKSFNFGQEQQGKIKFVTQSIKKSSKIKKIKKKNQMDLQMIYEYIILNEQINKNNNIQNISQIPKKRTQIEQNLNSDQLNLEKNYLDYEL